MFSVYSLASGKVYLKRARPVVEVLRLRRDPIAAVVVPVPRREAVIEHLVVISLVEDQNSVVAQRRVELGQGLTTVLLARVECVNELPRQMMASYLPWMPRFSSRQSAWTAFRMSPRFWPFSNALASMAAEPSTLMTSKPASVRRME